MLEIEAEEKAFLQSTEEKAVVKVATTAPSPSPPHKLQSNDNDNITTTKAQPNGIIVENNNNNKSPTTRRPLIGNTPIKSTTTTNYHSPTKVEGPITIEINRGEIVVNEIEGKAKEGGVKSGSPTKNKEQSDQGQHRQEGDVQNILVDTVMVRQGDNEIQSEIAAKRTSQWIMYPYLYEGN